MQYEGLGTDISKKFFLKKLYTMFEYKYPKGYYFDGEEHDFWEIVCVLDGEIGVSIDEKIYNVGANQAIFLKPMQFHRLWAEKSTMPHLFIVSFSVGGEFDIEKAIYKLSKERKEDIFNLLKMAENIFEFNDIFVKSVKNNADIKAHIFANKMENFIISLYDNQSYSDNVVVSGKTKYFENIINFLKNNLDKNLSIKAIAENVGMSESNLKKVFNTFTGKGVIDYFNNIKINHAKQLLSMGISVKECAKKTGFPEQNYFSNVFKKFTGLSPKNWLASQNKSKNLN